MTIDFMSYNVNNACAYVDVPGQLLLLQHIHLFLDHPTMTDIRM